jgi:UDP-N-acetylmuramate--alanine ligase
MRFFPGQHVHLIGIGGAGLSAIARILLEKGCQVSGSDRSRNALTDALARDGATIYAGHDASYVNAADCVIVTSAAQADHVEVAAARARNIPVYKRADIMAALMEGKRVIAVAGTHGKTTTTAMMVHILRECGKDPSYIVGGVMRNTGTNAGVGKGDVFVVEADEYDNMFLGLRPDVAVITNIEFDHPDFFKSENELYKSFEQFAELLSPSIRSQLILCVDSPLAARLAWEKTVKLEPLSYGIENPSGGAYRGVDIKTTSEGLTSFEFRVVKNVIGRVTLRIPGKHNVQNALAALIVAGGEGIEFIDIANALATFQGTGRRFELRGEVDGVAVIDDYAHHPTAIKVTLEAARQRYPERVLWAVWQPHTYSRTQALMDEYIRAFDNADHVLITDIYTARENPIPGVTSAAVVAQMNHPDARHTPSFEDTVKVLDQEVQAPAVILIMSAGDAPAIGEAFLKQRLERHANPAG